VADIVSRGTTAAYVQRVQLSGPCHALGFVQPGTSAANQDEENEPQPTEHPIPVLTNVHQQLAQDLDTPLESSQLLHVNSSSQAAADVAVHLQLHITVRRDAPFFASLVVEYAARGCDSSSSSKATQPVVLIEPIGISTDSGSSQATYKHRYGDRANPFEVSSCASWCCMQPTCACTLLSLGRHVQHALLRNQSDACSNANTGT
jgi:hypothetical protein